jgi:hypothetical protein
MGFVVLVFRETALCPVSVYEVTVTIPSTSMTEIVIRNNFYCRWFPPPARLRLRDAFTHLIE